MSAKPWIVPILALRRAPGTRREEHRVGSVGGLVVAGSVVRADAPVTVDATLEWVGEGIEVAAGIHAPWTGECRRCLTALEGELRSDVRELYRPGGGSEADEDTYPLDGDQIDLAPLVRDALLLELPIAPLCREDCAGLCPTCGADLAAGACDCPAPVVDERWSVLDALRAAAAPAEGPGRAGPGGSPTG